MGKPRTKKERIQEQIDFLKRRLDANMGLLEVCYNNNNGVPDIITEYLLEHNKELEEQMREAGILLESV